MTMNDRGSERPKPRYEVDMPEERSTYGICRDILRVMNEEGDTNKTRIIQRACLDWYGFQKQFNILLEYGFVVRETEGDIETYTITDKGHTLFECLNSLDELINKNKSNERVNNGHKENGKRYQL